MTSEESLIKRYFDAFNRHDLDGVMECFHHDAVVIGPYGKRVEGRDNVRRHYRSGFDGIPDGNCELRMCTGNNGRAVAESRFTGTQASSGKAIEAMGAELMEIVDGKIKEIRDYHQSAASSKAA